MKDNPSSPKSAWVQLYEARNTPAIVDTRPPGRPPNPIPRKKVGLTLSQGEISEMEAWQERLSSMLRRNLSTGETIGILLRISTARYTGLTEDDQQPQNLSQLVEWMIGSE